MRKNKMQRMKRAAALILACTMLMGQTVWAQAADVESELQEHGETVEGQAGTDDSVGVQEQTGTDNSSSSQERTGANDSTSAQELQTEEERLTSGQELQSAEKILEATSYDADGEPIIYLGIGEKSGIGYDKDENSVKYKMQSEDPSICQVAEGVEFYDEESEKYQIVFDLTGISEGETYVDCILDDEVIWKHHVIVSEDFGGEYDDEYADGEYEAELTNIYIGQPVMIDPYLDYSEGASYRIECKDEGICKAELCTYTEYDTTGAYITIDGISEGKTVLYLMQDDEVIRTYEVRVQELPADAVRFNDISLRTQLIEEYDRDENGYLSKEEMLPMKEWYAYAYGMYSACSIKTLDGLENAVNLKNIYLYNQVELTDIDALLELESLECVDLGSAVRVSVEDKWKLADFKNQELVLGEKMTLPVLGDIFDDSLSVEIVSGSEYVQLDDCSGYVQLTAQKAGKAELKFQYEGYSTQISVTVEGIDAKQDVGEEYPVDISNVNNEAEHSAYPGSSLIMDSNHRLWQTYPEGEKVRNNVKEYVANNVYFGTGHRYYTTFTYLLDMDNILWNGTQKLAEDVVSFDGRYALNSKGELINIYNSGNEKIENVKEWYSPNYGGSGVYILKTDGTLWTRQEVADGKPLNELEFVDEDVQQIMRGKYLKKDGTVILHRYGIDNKGKLSLDADISRLGDVYNTYYDKEGNCYFEYYEGFWYEETGSYMERQGFANMGKMEIIEDCTDYNGTHYLLSSDGEVYAYDLLKQTKTLILSGADQMNPEGISRYSVDEFSWAFHTKEGIYYDINGTALQQYREKSLEVYARNVWDEFSLMVYDDGSRMAERNGIPVLDCVTDIWQDSSTGQYFALRTDGTVWNITKVPVQVLDLKDTGFDTGDLNDDNSVNLMDLMMCLNHVAKKSELTGDALAASDINGDGKVDLIDLMRILNYVSKKTSAL